MPNSENPKQRGWKILETLAQIEKLATNEYSTTQEIAFSKLQDLLAHANQNQWWQSRIENFEKQTNIQNLLASLPVLDRSTIQLHWDEMQVAMPNFGESAFDTTSTSGSTGKPVIIRRFLPIFGYNNIASQLLAFKWHKVDQSLPMLQLRWNGKSYRVPKSGSPWVYLGNVGPYRAVDLRETTMAEVVDFIDKEKVGLLFGMASAFKLVATAAQAAGYKFPTLQKVFNRSERLEPQIRKEAEEQFGVKIVDRYSSEELGMIALDCPFDNHLHVIPTHNFVEILDENNELCEIGQPGRVVVTNLSNFGMPLIRYELGDIAAFGEPCSYGITFPVIVPKIYRTKELLVDARRESFSPSAAGAKSLKNSSIQDFLVYRFTNAIVVLYTGVIRLGQEEISTISEELQDRFRCEHPVSVFFQENMDWADKWKRKDFIRVDQPFDGNFSVDKFKTYK